MSDDEREVLAANDAFYEAFARGDAPALEGLWAGRGVACIHPGWPPLDGRDAVLESWRQIFRAGGPNIRCGGGRAYVHGNTAFVICIEHLDGGDLVATNYFVREADTWKIAHHQAGAVATLPPEGDSVVH